MNNTSYIRILLCAILLLVRINTTHAINQPVVYSHLTNNDGLSNSAVNTIFQDSEGLMWFGTWDGLNKYDGMYFKQYRPQSKTATSLSHQVIRSIAEEDKDHLWITTDYGINRMDKRNETFSHYFLSYKSSYIYQENSFSCSISKDGTIAASHKSGQLYLFDKDKKDFVPVPINGANDYKGAKRLFFDKNGCLWIFGSDNRLMKIEISTDRQANLKYDLQLPEHIIDIFFDKYSRIWFTLDNMLYYINTEENNPQIKPTGIALHGTLNTVFGTKDRIMIGTTNGCYELKEGNLTKYINTNVSVLSLFIGSQDILWIGTDGKGLYRQYQKPNFISLISKEEYSSAGNFPVRAIHKDKYGTIWIGTKGGGLSMIENSNMTDNRQFNNYNVGDGRTYNSVLSLAEGDDCIWIGTDGTGLQYYDRASHRLRRLKFSNAESEETICSVYTILQTDPETLYVGTSGQGMFRLSINDRKEVTGMKQYKHNTTGNSISSNIVYAIIQDGDCLWIATRGGGLNRFDTRQQTFEIYKNSQNSNNTICSNDIISLLKDKSGHIWAGTTSGLSMIKQGKDKKPEFVHFTENEGLANTNIHAILEDCYNSIWVSTSNGLAQINPSTQQIVNYYYEDGLQGNEFSDGACYSNPQGTELYFGGIDGINIVNPTLISSKKYMPSLIINDILLDNKSYKLEDNTIKTSYTTGTINLYFSVIDYLDNKKCQLAYRLERKDGLFYSKNETQWNNIGNNRNIILNELSPGKYSLYVKTSNAEQKWSEPIKIEIIITSPVWATKWAILLYVIIIIAGIRIFYIVKKTRLIMRHELEMEKQEKLKKEEIHQAKLRFFTNIAHEFSNSITLIYGAVEQIFIIEKPDEKIKKQLLAIRRNAERMHTQIQELMDFRKADTGHLRMQLEKVDVNELIKCTLDNFIDKAESKKINLTYNIQDNLPIWIADRSMLEKIIFNLLSNATKYTPSEGQISISAKTDESKQLFITCTNSGPGIKPEDMKNIFNRFTVLDNFETKMSQGMYTRNGIGLAMCKDLATLMGGNIIVDSKEGEYTSFTITLPHHEESEIPVVEKIEHVQPNKNKVLFANQKHVILVVDDQEDIRNLIKEILGNEYDVISAANGNDALEILRETIPNLIICDIVMPGISGIDFIKMIKNDERTKYIPVIMLSSNSSIESHITVLETGANMFISKPFHPRYLKAAVERMLHDNEAMKTFSESSAAYKEKYNNTLISKEDRIFIDKVIEALSKNFGDENYNQDALAEDLAISRVQLYRKIKQIAQTTTGDFIRTYRLKQAENMLIHTDKTVQEIMQECGFHNKAYFYREFTKVHNCSPKDYRQQKLNGEKENTGTEE